MKNSCSVVENMLGCVKYMVSHCFHVFENCFGPQYAGQFRYEYLIRNSLRVLCYCLGGDKIQKIMKPTVQDLLQARKQHLTGLHYYQSIRLKLLNYSTWPTNGIPTAQYPPPPNLVGQNKCRITYMGHSGVFIQMDESNILVDNYFGRHLGCRWIFGTFDYLTFGVKRMLPPAFDITDNIISNIHLVLATHDHIDTFDKAFIRTLLHWSGPTFVSGKGMSKHIGTKDGPSLYFLDWYESIKYDLLKIQFLPAVHSSGRGFFLDRNSTLWGSFLICSETFTLYHAGGTGYSEHFKLISENVQRLGRRIDLAILPVGHYEIGASQNIYLTPFEAVQAHCDLNAIRSLGVQHDTFPLGIEQFGQVRRDLIDALHRKSISPEIFFLLEPGQHIYLSDDIEQTDTAVGRSISLGEWVNQTMYN